MTEIATDAAELAAKKDELRTRIRAIRAGLARAIVRTRSEEASARLLDVVGTARGRVVALFAAIEAEGELDPRSADRGLRAAGHTPVYPRVANRRPPRLTFHRVADPGALAAGPLGVPTPPATDEVPLADIDVFVVPGIAFTQAGARLGFGGGYYDATLAAAPRARRIAFTHPEQLVDTIPETPRDERVDELVLPDRTLSCPRRPRSDEAGVAVPGAKP